MPKRKAAFPLTAAYLEELHDEGISLIWPGVEPVGRYDCLDLNLLESAAKQPFQAGFGVEFYPTIYDKAACLFFSIAGGHIFANGNKRTAVLTLDQFLYANSIFLIIPNRQMEKLAIDTASYRTRGENSKDVIAKLSSTVQANSIPFSAVGKSYPEYKKLQRIRRLVRTHLLNAPDAKPRQALLRGR